MKWEQALSKWRKDRNITSMDDASFISSIRSEIHEYNQAFVSDDWHEMVDALCDIVVFVQNELDTRPGDPAPVTTTLSNINDITQLLEISSKRFGTIQKNVLISIKDFCMKELDRLGVIFELAMKQTIKEISSRKQDPVQAKEWAKSGPKGKWQKDRNQAKETLYKADYNLCKKAKKDNQ